MALKSSLKFISKRISQAVQNSAALQGLAPGDYALAGSYDQPTERISLTLGTDRSIDEGRWYADTLDEIRRLFPEFPYLTMHVGIVVRKVANLDEVYIDYADADDEMDLTEMLQHA